MNKVCFPGPVIKHVFEIDNVGLIQNYAIDQRHNLFRCEKVMTPVFIVNMDDLQFELFKKSVEIAPKIDLIGVMVEKAGGSVVSCYAAIARDDDDDILTKFKKVSKLMQKAIEVKDGVLK